DLQLLQQIGRGDERRAAEALPGIGGARVHDSDGPQRRNQDRPVVAGERQARRDRTHLNSSSVFLTRSTRSAPMLTAARRMIPSNSGCSSGAMSEMRKKNEMTLRIIAPK